MKTTIKFGVMALLSMALFVMAFAAVPIASADSNCAGAYCSYGHISGTDRWYFSAYDYVNCPNVQWAALWITLYVDDTLIPPTDVPSPCYYEFEADSVGGYAWAEWYCSVHGYGSSA